MVTKVSSFILTESVSGCQTERDIFVFYQIVKEFFGNFKAAVD